MRTASAWNGAAKRRQGLPLHQKPRVGDQGPRDHGPIPFRQARDRREKIRIDEPVAPKKTHRLHFREDR
jgi:hypothetical protein